MHAVARDSLAGALGLGTREVLSLVGAGGKTTALHRLGRELAAGGSRVVASTTTAMFLSQMAVVGPVLMETGRTELVPRLRRALLSGRAAAVARRVRGGEGRTKAAEPFATTAGLAENGTPFVLLTVTDVKGSTPRGVGAKMLVLGDGTTVETIGGGLLERRAIADAQDHLASGKSRAETYQLNAQGDRALGGLCGGEVTVFFEPHMPGRALLIIGAGHVGQKLCSCASLLDYRVVVVDPRPDMVTPERFPEADGLICGDPARTSELCEIGEDTNAVIVTHTAEHDEEALRSVIGAPATSPRGWPCASCARGAWWWRESRGSESRMRVRSKPCLPGRRFLSSSIRRHRRVA